MLSSDKRREDKPKKQKLRAELPRQIELLNKLLLFTIKIRMYLMCSTYSIVVNIVGHHATFVK